MPVSHGALNGIDRTRKFGRTLSPRVASGRVLAMRVPSMIARGERERARKRPRDLVGLHERE
jgi:hypothetical protein